MLVRTYTDLYKKFDNGSNPGLIQTVQLSADEHQSKLDALIWKVRHSRISTLFERAPTSGVSAHFTRSYL
ncbi:hypothetical protein TNIN_429891 [Trichonephila inaurata madagascariensis]|uniref:Uncharacterized protein n=1 Tax=Trichonephila inaurata madagascariensis TaxID=2747483 RepID=A0A8X6XG92_9ARAC|nr:hypothetical protein TNIN_429891 [Trichonephila inaurata madagascariensis]